MGLGGRPSIPWATSNQRENHAQTFQEIQIAVLHGHVCSNSQVHRVCDDGKGAQKFEKRAFAERCHPVIFWLTSKRSDKWSVGEKRTSASSSNNQIADSWGLGRRRRREKKRKTNGTKDRLRPPPNQFWLYRTLTTSRQLFKGAFSAVLRGSALFLGWYGT